MIQKIVDSRFLHKALILLVAILFYHNTVSNDFALDDLMVLTENSFVHQGLAGIPDILSHDSFYGATQKASSNLGWRYRPLSLISFAIEYSLFQENAQGYHFMNLFFYALLGIVLYRFALKWMFPNQPSWALGLALLFVASPVHPEVVANIKSRDEIFSLLFLVLYLHELLNYGLSRKYTHLLSALLLLVLALMSKESNFLAFIYTPVMLYVLHKTDIPTSIRLSWPFMTVVVLYMMIRIWVNPFPEIQNNLMNDPYALATSTEKPATILFILMKYLQLMTFPNTLIFDYGYNHISYRQFNDGIVLCSVLLHAIALLYALRAVMKRDLAGVVILFYLLGIFLVSNAFVLVGPPMAERFLFTPGFFFLSALVILLYRLQTIMNIKVLTRVLPVSMLVYSTFCFFMVHARNPDWKDNQTLYFADVKKAPNSFRIQAFCGSSLYEKSKDVTDLAMRKQLLEEAIGHFTKAYAIYPGYAMMYQNWGGCYQQLGNIDSTAWAWSIYKSLLPDSRFNAANDEMIATMRYNACVEEYQRAKARMNIPELISIQRRAVSFKPGLAPAWLFLGKLYFSNNQKDSAVLCWEKSIQLQPDLLEAQSLLRQYKK